MVAAIEVSAFETTFDHCVPCSTFHVACLVPKAKATNHTGVLAMELQMTKCLCAVVLFSGVMLGQQSPSAGQFNIATTQPTEMTTASSAPVPPPPSPAGASPAKRKLGPLEISVN